MQAVIEHWRPIKGYEGLYEVSDYGGVRSLVSRYGRRKKVRYNKPQEVGNGYLHIALSRDGKKKWYMLHRLVAEAFIANPDNLPQVNHKDECKTNNWVSNLEWMTAKDNSNYGSRNGRIGKTKTNNEKESIPVLQLTCDGELVKEWPSMHEAARNGYDRRHISQCCRGIPRYKSHAGFIWKYKNERDN